MNIRPTSSLGTSKHSNRYRENIVSDEISVDLFRNYFKRENIAGGYIQSDTKYITTKC